MEEECVGCRCDECELMWYEEGWWCVWCWGG